MAAPIDSRPSFNDLSKEQWNQGNFLCVGLDADTLRLPPHLADMNPSRFFGQARFLQDIVDATAPYAGFFKPNIAFFEDHESGLRALEETVGYIHGKYPDKPVIGDTKRADIGNTMGAYKRMIGRYGFDAITLNTQYFGGDSLEPLEDMPDTGFILMAKTSNRGSAELQDMPINLKAARDRQQVTPDEFDELRNALDGQDPMVHEMVAFMAARRWNRNGNLGLVYGATHPEAYATARKLTGDVPYLIPGIGTQDGDLEKTLQYAPDSKGQGMYINNGRAIIFASRGTDYAEAAGKAAKASHDQITLLNKMKLLITGK